VKVNGVDSTKTTKNEENKTIPTEDEENNIKELR
jgi:hypothetical protein